MQFPDIYKCSIEGYSVIGNDGTQITFADSGKLRKRILFDETQYEIRFQIIASSGQEVLNVRNFYNTYKYELIDWLDPFTGQLYSVSMTAEPRVVRTNKTYAWMEIQMQGVINVP